MTVSLVHGIVRQLCSSADALESISIGVGFDRSQSELEILADKLDLEIERLRVTSLLLRSSDDESPRNSAQTEVRQ